jgi:hypothetical protein
MAAAPAASASNGGLPAGARLAFFASQSALARGEELASSAVSLSRGTLRRDKTQRVICQYTEAGGAQYVFVRLALSELRGKTAFDVWLPGKGTFYCYACAPHGTAGLLRLNLESTGWWPVDGAPEDKLYAVVNPKMWPPEVLC